MRFSFGLLAALQFAAASALAADLPSVKPASFAPPPTPAAASPFYLGVFGGAAFGGSGTSFGGKNLFCFDGVESGGPCGLAGGAPNGGLLRSSPRTGDSPFGGIRIGADFAISRTIVLGGVADIAVMNRKVDSRYEYSNFSLPGVFGADRGVLSSSLNTNWIGTLRAKVGLNVSDQLVFFGTGGMAFVNIRSSVQNEYDVVNGGTSVLNGGASVQRGSLSGVALGYAVGGGLEYQFARHLSASLEYLYYSASKDMTVTQTSGAPLAPPSFVAKVEPSGHLLRVGLDYKL